MLIYTDDLVNLQVSIKTKTDTDGTHLVLEYMYTDRDETYNDIPLTINAMSPTDTINIYYYNINDNTIHGYYGSFKPTEVLDAVIETWYYSPIVMHSPNDILNIVGAYRSSFYTEMYPAVLSNGLYYVHSYAPLVYSNHINIKGALLMKPIDRLGYGNGTLRLMDSGNIIHKNIIYISWEDFTILPSLYLTNIGNNDITISLETVDDLFNVQLEFS
jgi:hypothetical protein